MKHKDRICVITKPVPVYEYVPEKAVCAALRYLAMVADEQEKRLHDLEYPTEAKAATNAQH